MAGTLDTTKLTQVGFIVRDIETTKRKFAAFLGVEVPATITGGEYEVTGTTFLDQPAPDANCFMAFFDVGPGVQLELIQPNGAPSTWQSFLDEHGEGMHHIAFAVKNTQEKLEKAREMGFKVVQQGKYGNAGGEYAYIDAMKDLKCFIETLESY